MSDAPGQVPTDAETARALAAAVARSAELVAELEERTEHLDAANRELAAANARSAELVAELQGRREELEWTNASLRQVDEENKRLLSAAAHDLRGGLGRILALAEQVSSASSDRERLLEAEAARLVELLDRLLGDSRDESGHIVVKAQTIAVEAYLADIVASHEAAALRKAQSIELRCEPAEIRLDADPVRLRQVLDNLISNAIKFSRPGTRIEVSVREERGDVEFVVADEGPGLTGEDLGRVFGEFERLSAQPTGGEASHGLGLSIVKRIVEAHGGTVTAANRSDRSGARFTVLLPAPVRPGDHRRILLIDDDRTNRRLIGSQLTRLGHTIEEFSDGVRGVARVLDVEPDWFDLILMDLEMPGMSGTEASRLIRSAHRDVNALPIVAVSGHADREHVRAVLEAGMNDLLAKPVRSAGLRCLLRRWS